MSHVRHIMVCVTQQKTCERLIRRGASLRLSEQDELYVINVARDGWNFLNSSQEGEALEYLFSISKSVGANLTVLKSADVEGSIVDFARENRISMAILGESPENQQENNMTEKIKKSMPEVEFVIIPSESPFEEEVRPANTTLSKKQNRAKEGLQWSIRAGIKNGKGKGHTPVHG